MNILKKLLIRIVVLALPAALLLGAGSKNELELVMVERTVCEFCKLFDADIGAGYAESEMGKHVPLRRINVDSPWPQDLTDVKSDRLTPTFILVKNGQEASRLRGYPGPEKFWNLMRLMMESLDKQ